VGEKAEMYPQITQIQKIKDSCFCENLCNLWINNVFSRLPNCDLALYTRAFACRVVAECPP
jgi:hypothetical protein